MSPARWTRPALRHLQEIADYIARDNPQAARRVVGFVREQVGVLSSQPGIGRPGRIDGTRELVVSRFPYIVVYRTSVRGIDVLAVIHTSRRWPGQLP
ncbi:MAG: type II toxin-antitoxin system RelE/ParE family toxin [Betaproteobacteria bacterium]|nr:type II toxin-antitoxin system RelE/ParE family toxin [Betaproteobacteria bacterium]